MRRGFAPFAFLGLAIGLNGQIATTTALVGTVTDSSGSAVVGAKITATEAATQGKYTAVTNQDGNYRIDFVRVGTYDVTGEYPGFKTMRQAGSVVEINQVVRNDFVLSPGAVTESITVESTKDRKSTRLNSSHQIISYAVFFLKKKTCKH